MLFILIKNELIKILKRTKTWVVFGLFVVLICGVAFLNKKQDENMRYYQSTQIKIEMTENELNNINLFIEENEDNKEEWAIKEVAENKSRVQILEKSLERLKKEKDIPENEKDWKSELIEKKENLISQLESEHNTEIKEDIKQQIEIIDITIDNDVKNIESWEFNGINYIISFIELLGIVILAVGIAVFMSDIVSGESTPPTLKFLLVQPISRTKVILSKFIAITVTVVVMIVGLEGATIGIIGAFNGFDAGKMPTIINTQYKLQENINGGQPELMKISGSGIITTRGDLLLQSMLMQILFIVCCCAFIFLISAMFKSSMITMSIAVMSCVVVNIITGLSETVRSFAKYIFLIYGNTVSIVTGDIGVKYGSVDMTITSACIVMIITTIVCYVLAQIIFNKKDILI